MSNAWVRSLFLHHHFVTMLYPLEVAGNESLVTLIEFKAFTMIVKAESIEYYSFPFFCKVGQC